MKNVNITCKSKFTVHKAGYVTRHTFYPNSTHYRHLQFQQNRNLTIYQESFEIFPILNIILQSLIIVLTQS